MMVKGVWFSLDEALPPLDNCGNYSIIVALVLKSGAIVKGLRSYNSELNDWIILDGKGTELSDNEIAGWIKIPSF